ncbi:MAG: flagellar export protein FliJ [Pseudomonadota bacterium]
MLEHAERERDEALAELQQARQMTEGQERQAQSLQDWRRDYQSRWQAQFQQSGGVEIMRCYQDFMQRLGSAVSDQDVKVAQARARQERCQAALLERERKVAAIAQLLERRQAERQRQQARQEQKATDELAARQHRAAPWHGDPSGPPTVT